MKFLKKWLLLKLCFILALPINVYPQATFVAQPDNVTRAVSGVLLAASRGAGLVASDPRVINTLVRASYAIAAGAAVAGGITVGAVTAPAWASVAVSLAVWNALPAITKLGTGAVNWLFRPDGKIDTSTDTTTGTSNTPGMTIGGFYYKAQYYIKSGSSIIYSYIYGTDGESIARQARANNQIVVNQVFGTNTPVDTAVTCVGISPDPITCGGDTAAYSSINGAPNSCPPGNYYLSGGTCTLFTYQVSAAAPQSAVTPQAAIGAIPASELVRPLNPAIIAGLANQAWQRAASQAGYDGIPYPVSNPITAAQVQNWYNANPTIAPRIGDFTAPNPVTATSTVPWALPSNPSSTAPTTTATAATVPNVGTINPASANPITNLGVDPVTAAPTLELTPTAPMILAPILNMLPGLRTFNVIGHTATCPKPTVSLVGKTITMDAHCTVIDSIKPILQTAMLFAWAAFALFIILAA
jgi:hypothetical protein